MSRWPQQAHARDLLAREAGCIRKGHAGRLRVALAFPNTYHVGMSNLGFQAVYRLFNDLDEVVCERTFMPPRQQLADALRTGAPLITLESQTAVREFDLLAFSVSFEWDYPNLVTMLRLAGLPVWAEERAARHPLVVAGGAVTFLNPEPFAPFIDVVAVGEGEVLVPGLVRNVLSATSRAGLLAQLASEPGFYVPSLVAVEYAADRTVAGFSPSPAAEQRVTIPVQKAVLPASSAVNPPSTVVFTPDTEFGSRLLVEVVRGCPNLCRFCWAGYNYLPVRPFDTSAIIHLAERSRGLASRIGLVSIALCDHPDIVHIAERLQRLGYRISPASLRLDDLTEPFVRALRVSGERTLTIAPETGSDRLRRVVNKSFDNDAILDRAEMVFATGIENLKLYFMIGLPTETDDDLVAIRDLVVRIRERMLTQARGRGRVGRIVASVNPLIPKPGTAYQWMPMGEPAMIERKMRRLRALVGGIDNVFFTIKSERHAHFQALLSLGDRRVSRAVEAAERLRGNWVAAVREAGIDTDFFLFRDRSRDAWLPWDIVAGFGRRDFLRSEFERGLRAETTEPARRG